MISKYQYLLLFLILYLSRGSASPSTADNFIRLRAGVHFDSKVSGGKYTLEELGRIIASSGLDIAIITDHDNMKVTYGIKPFHNFLKYSISENSVSDYGFKKYVSEIDKLDQMYKNVTLIPGVEAVPFYYWEGSPFDKNLKLRNWHTHLLVFGFRDEKLYEGLPSIANGIGYRKPSGDLIKYLSKNFLHFALIILYFVLFLFSLFSILKRRRVSIHKGNIRKVRFSFTALIFTVIFGLILASEAPFLPPLYDQYSGYQGGGPFQELIDYVNQNDGLIFWAHPEVSHNERRMVNFPLLSQEIEISTDAYPELILDTRNYTGFAAFWEGMKVIGRPGGLWDIALKEYCRGIGSKPVWAIGELDFEESNDLSLIRETNTFVFVKERSRESILDAFRAGRMYLTRNFFGDKAFLDDFTIFDLYTEESAFIGETLNLTHLPVAIHIRIRHQAKPSRPLQLLLFRNEVLMKRFLFTDILDEWVVDEEGTDDKMFYYKIVLGEEWPVLLTNPVFVRKVGY